MGWFKSKLLGFVRSSQKSNLHAQGYGRHTIEEVANRVDEDANAIAHILGDKDFFFGESPSSYDAIVAGFFALVEGSKADNVILEKLRAHENLVAHAKRIASLCDLGDKDVRK